MINSNLINLESSKKDIPVIKHRGVLMCSTAKFEFKAAAAANDIFLIMPIKFTSAIKSIGVFGKGAGAAGNLDFLLVPKESNKEILTNITPTVTDAAASYADWKYAAVYNPDTTLYQQMCTVETVEGKSRYVETAVFAPYKNDDFGYLAMKASVAVPITRSYLVHVEYVEQLSQARNTDQP